MLGINSWPRQQTCLKGPFRPCNSELSQMKVDNRVTNSKDNCSPQRDTTLRDDLVLWQPKPDSIRLALLLTLSFRFYHAYKSQLCGTRAASFFCLLSPDIHHTIWQSDDQDNTNSRWATCGGCNCCFWYCRSQPGAPQAHHNCYILLILS